MAIDSNSSVTFEPDSLRRLWLWFAWLSGIGYLAFLFIGILAIVEAPMTYFVSSVICIVGVVIGFVLLYRFWSLIQDARWKARTSPGKAVGFCFIPFFNIYWSYVAYVGLSKDMNFYCDERNIAGRRVSEGLALSCFILGLINILIRCISSIFVREHIVFAALPYIRMLADITTMIIGIILMKQFVDTSRGIIEFKSK